MENNYNLQKKGSQYIWLKKDEDILLEFYREGKSLLELCQIFNIKSPITIRKKLKELNEPIVGKRNQYPVDENFFEEIDTKEKAYWLGFFYADGFVSNKTNTIGFASKDLCLLNNFKKSIKAYNHKAGFYIDNRFSKPIKIYQIKIRSKKLVEDLIKWGCVPNKSYKLNNFPKIKEEFLPHFIRGVMDGDGSIFCYFNHGLKEWRLSFTGDKNFIEELRDYFKLENKIVKTNKDSKTQTYTLIIGGNLQVERILNIIYKNSTKELRLERKYEIYLSLVKRNKEYLENK